MGKRERQGGKEALRSLPDCARVRMCMCTRMQLARHLIRQQPSTLLSQASTAACMCGHSQEAGVCACRCWDMSAASPSLLATVPFNSGGAGTKLRRVSAIEATPSLFSLARQSSSTSSEGCLCQQAAACRDHLLVFVFIGRFTNLSEIGASPSSEVASHFCLSGNIWVTPDEWCRYSQGT